MTDVFDGFDSDDAVPDGVADEVDSADLPVEPTPLDEDDSSSDPGGLAELEMMVAEDD